jgi:hypothetical protein
LLRTRLLPLLQLLRVLLRQIGSAVSLFGAWLICLRYAWLLQQMLLHVVVLL